MENKCGKKRKLKNSDKENDQNANNKNQKRLQADNKILPKQGCELIDTEDDIELKNIFEGCLNLSKELENLGNQSKSNFELYKNQLKENKKLQLKCETLENEKIAFQNQLLMTIKNLQKKIIKLQRECDALENEKMAFQNNLLINKNQLEENKKLQLKCEALENEKIALENEKIALENEKIALKNEKTALQNTLLITENKLLIAENKLLTSENKLLKTENELLASSKQLKNVQFAEFLDVNKVQNSKPLRSDAVVDLESDENKDPKSSESENGEVLAKTTTVSDLEYLKSKFEKNESDKNETVSQFVTKFDKPTSSKEKEEINAVNEAESSMEIVQTKEDELEPETGSDLFVKNLNFGTAKKNLGKNPRYKKITNPICRLKEIQERKKENPPVYTVLDENGGPLNQVTIQCSLGDVSTTGSSQNKRKAKQNAARAMLQLIGYTESAISQQFSSRQSFFNFQEIKKKLQLQQQQNQKASETYKMKIVKYDSNAKKPWSKCSKFTVAPLNHCLSKQQNKLQLGESSQEKQNFQPQQEKEPPPENTSENKIETEKQK